MCIPGFYYLGFEVSHKKRRLGLIIAVQLYIANVTSSSPDGILAFILFVEYLIHHEGEILGDSHY